MIIKTKQKLTLNICFSLFLAIFLLASVSAVSCGEIKDETPVSAGLTFGGIGQASGGGNSGGDAWEVKDTKGSQSAPVLDTYWKSRVTRMFSANSYNKEIYLDLGALKCVRGLTVYQIDSADSQFLVSYSEDGSSWQTIQSINMAGSIKATSKLFNFDSKAVVARYLKLELMSNPDNIVKVAHISAYSGIAVPDSADGGAGGSGTSGTGGTDTDGSGGLPGDAGAGIFGGDGDIPAPSDPFADNRDATNNLPADKMGSILPSKSIPSIITSILFGVLIDDGSILFTKLLLLILVFAIIYAVLSSVDFGIFTGRMWLVWIVSIIVAILSVRFLTPEFISMIMIPHSTLGVVLTAGIPFVIFAAVVLKLPSGTLRRIAWIFFAVVFAGVWWTRREDLGGIGGFVTWIYPAVIIFSIIMALIDGTIQRYRNKIKGESLQADVNQNLIIDLQKKIAEDAKDYAAGTMRKDSYESRLRKYNQAIASLSK